MRINVPLLRKTLEHLTEHPELHLQHVWWIKTECGTVGCVAGWSVHLSGMSVTDDPFGAIVTVAVPGHPSVRKVAEDLLGLDPNEAVLLFNSRNTLADLWRLAASFTQGEIGVPEQFLGESL